MSEPKHIYMRGPHLPNDGVAFWRRYTLTDGPEYRALIDLGRNVLRNGDLFEVSSALRDLLDYLEANNE